MVLKLRIPKFVYHFGFVITSLFIIMFVITALFPFASLPHFSFSTTLQFAHEASTKHCFIEHIATNSSHSKRCGFQFQSSKRVLLSLHATFLGLVTNFFNWKKKKAIRMFWSDEFLYMKWERCLITLYYFNVFWSVKTDVFDSLTLFCTQAVLDPI